MIVSCILIFGPWQLCIWHRALGQTSLIYCRYIHDDEAGTKLYCLVTEAYVCKQLALAWSRTCNLGVTSLVRYH